MVDRKRTAGLEVPSASRHCRRFGIRQVPKGNTGGVEMNWQGDFGSRLGRQRGRRPSLGKRRRRRGHRSAKRCQCNGHDTLSHTRLVSGRLGKGGRRPRPPRGAGPLGHAPEQDATVAFGCQSAIAGSAQRRDGRGRMVARYDAGHNAGASGGTTLGRWRGVSSPISPHARPGPPRRSPSHAGGLTRPSSSGGPSRWPSSCSTSGLARGSTSLSASTKPAASRRGSPVRLASKAGCRLPA